MTTSVNTKKILDFGAKIGGARKDMYTKITDFADSLAKITGDDLAKNALSKLAKLPDLEKLFAAGAISADRARALLTLWRSIPRRPVVGEWTGTRKLNRWIDKVISIMSDMSDILAGGAVSSDIQSMTEYQVLKAAEWPKNAFNFGKYRVETYGFDYIKSCCKYSFVLATGKACFGNTRTNDVNEIIATLKERLANDSASRADGPKLAIYCNRFDVYYIAPDGKPEIAIQEYQTKEEAQKAYKEDRAALVARYKQIRNFPDLRRDWNRPRVGKDWRNGADVTPEHFAAVLPFRGVEFGNWVTQTERAALLNSAFDGFHDLADLFSFPVANVTLSGSLAFAFASRGIPGAMAHYEPVREVINLTKKSGAGCMAHEWFHAVDHWASINGACATEEAGTVGHRILTAIYKTEYYERSKEIARFAPGDYWIKGRELTARAFEGVCMVVARLSGVCSDFLCNVVGFDDFTKADVFHRSGCYPYPTEAEALELLPLYLDFFRSVFGAGVSVAPEVMAAVESAKQAAQAEREEAEALRLAKAKEEEEKEKQQKAAAEAAAKKEQEQKKEMVRPIIEKLEKWGFSVFGLNTAYCSNAVVVGQTIYIFEAAKSGLAFGSVKYECNRRYRRVHLGKDSVVCGSVRAEDFLKKSLAGMARFEIIRALKYRLVSLSESAFFSVIKTAKEEEEKKEQQRKAEAAAKIEKNVIEGNAVVSSNTINGLWLVDIPEGVAVVGDSRTTYRHRKEIKAKGCAWNREAKRWEATTPEAVAAVKTWFGVADSVQNQPTDQTAEIEAVEPTGEEVETVQAAAAAAPSIKTESIPNYGDSEKVEKFGICKDLVFKISKQKVFTAQQLAKLAKLPLYSQDGKKGDTVAVVKFFCGSYTWYITELDPFTGEAFGVTVSSYGAELGYVSIPELADLVGRAPVSGGGLSGSIPYGVERDINFEPIQLKDIQDEAVKDLCHKLWD